MVAYNRNRKAIAESINADEVIFLSLEDLEAACAELSPRPEQKFEVGVFCGKYVTPVSEGYLEGLEKGRGNAKDGSPLVTVGDSVMSKPTVVVEREDVSLHNLGSDI